VASAFGEAMGQNAKYSKEQMISALPPTSDIARQPRLTIESHLRLTPLLADAERREAVVFRHHH
jgi:hypothetical protein